ncbi:C-C chemokine receptor type 6 isoform X2 [Sardina pilchardus]
MDSYPVNATEDYDYNDSDTDYDLDYDPDGVVVPCNLNSNRGVGITINTYIYALICVFGLLGNVMVIVTYAFYKKAKSMTDVYLLNVAFADLIFVIALPLIIYNEHYDWHMGTVACKLLRGAYSINLYSSMLLLACISGDRYVAIVQARRSFGNRSRSLVYSRVICLNIWFFAVILSIPTVIYNQRVEEHGTFECTFKFDADDTSTARLMKVLLPSMQVSVGFFVPLLVMGFCYSSILVILLHTQSFQRHKAVRVVLAVVIVFVACHLPYNVVVLYHTAYLFKERQCETEQIILMTITVTRSLAYLHCCLNPILYAFIGVKFRNHMQKILVDLWCHGKKYLYTTRQTTSKQTSEVYVSAPCKSPEESNDAHQSSFTM